MKYICLVLCLVLIALCGVACGEDDLSDIPEVDTPSQDASSASLGEAVDIDQDRLVLVFEYDNKVIAELPVLSNALYIEDEEGKEREVFSNVCKVFKLVEHKELINLVRNVLETPFLGMLPWANGEWVLEDLPESFDLDGDGVAETPYSELFQTALAELLLIQYQEYIPLLPSEDAVWEYSGVENKTRLIYRYPGEEA